MSRVFNGVENRRLHFTGDLSGTLGLTALPVVMLAWFKPATLDFNGNVMSCQRAGTYVGAFHMQVRGGDAGDPLRLRFVSDGGAGVSVETAGNLLTTGGWQLGVVKLNSTSSRQCGVIKPGDASVTYGTTNTDNLTVTLGSLGILNIGAWYYDSYTFLFDGKIGQVGLWSGTVPSDANIVTAANQADWTGIAAAGIRDIWTMNAAGDETGIVNSHVLTNVGAGVDANDNPSFATPGPSGGAEALLVASSLA